MMRHLIFLVLYILANSGLLYAQIDFTRENILASAPPGIGVSFERSMSRAGKYDSDSASENDYWVYTKEQYNKFIRGINSLYTDKPSIPKVIHQIWIGSPMPEKERQLAKTIKKLHPNWEYKLWTDKEIQELGLVNKEIYDSCRNYGQKSDIARYEILYRFVVCILIQILNVFILLMYFIIPLIFMLG